MRMAEEFTGGCLCGAVRYRCRGEPQSQGLCQCERCQRQSGSAFLIAVVFAQTNVTLSGDTLNIYTVRDANGAALHRHFCGTCGSAIMITLDRYPDIRSMMGGTLDDKMRLKPTFSLWCSSAQPWLRLPGDIAAFEAYPDGLIA
jgi:hypothetical protein